MPLYALPHPQSLSPKDRVLKMDSSYLDVFFKSAFVVYAPVCTYRFMYVDGGMCLTVVPVFRQVPLFLVVLVFPRTGSPLSQAAPPCRPNTSGVHLGTTPHLTWLEGTQNAALLHARQLCKCRRAPPRAPGWGESYRREEPASRSEFRPRCEDRATRRSPQGVPATSVGGVSHPTFHLLCIPASAFLPVTLIKTHGNWA